jgi:hypothetical protein
MSLFHLWEMIIPCLTQMQRAMRPGVSSIIPEQQDKAWHSVRQTLKAQNNSISKVEYQNDVGHILRQSGNHSQRICSVRSQGE